MTPGASTPSSPDVLRVDARTVHRGAAKGKRLE
jgi:hypothetical protein